MRQCAVACLTAVGTSVASGFVFVAVSATIGAERTCCAYFAPLFDRGPLSDLCVVTMPLRQTPAAKRKAVDLQAEKDKAAKLRARAAMLENKGFLTSIMDAIKKRPECLPALYKHCQDCGLIDPNGSTAADSGATVEPHPLCSPGKGSSSTSADHDSPADGGDDDDEIPRSATRLSDFSVGRLVQLLHSCERNLNAHHLKLLKPPQKRQLSKAPLLELLEFMSGCPPDTFIGTDGPYKSMCVLQAAIDNLNQRNGRRCRDIELPPSWCSDRDGIYKIVFQPGEGATTEATIQVCHKYMNDDSGAPLMRPLPASLQSKVKHRAALCIQQNYSERNAVLIERAGPLRVNLITMFLERATGSCLESVPQELLDSLHKCVEDGAAAGDADESPSAVVAVSPPPVAASSPAGDASATPAKRSRSEASVKVAVRRKAATTA